MSNPWHVWKVVGNRQKRIMKFLSELDCIDDFLYPVAEKVYNTKNGSYIKSVPIYENYVFIQYNHTPIISSKIESCPWISFCIGLCSEDEIRNIQEQNKKNYDDLVSVERPVVGSKVKLVRTPFAGWDANIVSIDGDKLSASITILGSDRIIRCSIDDVKVVE